MSGELRALPASAEVVLAAAEVALHAQRMSALVHRDDRVQAVDLARPADVFDRFSRTVGSHDAPSIALEPCPRRRVPQIVSDSGRRFRRACRHSVCTRAVPIISEFFGIAVRMFYKKHEPAHFHAEYQRQQGTFDRLLDQLEPLQ